VPDLVAIDLPAGPRFVDELRRAWDRGDAVFPVDRRLPAGARAHLLQAMAPTIALTERGSERLSGRKVQPGDAAVLATSGSSGAPKGVVLTHDALAAAARATSQRLGITADDTWLACLPLSHAGGFGVVARALITGTPLMVHDGFDAALVQHAARQGATAVSLVSTALARIDTELFRVIVVGGSRPPDHLPGNVHSTYGLTETGGGVVYDRRPLEGVELAIAADGEVLVRSPMNMRAYRDDGRANEPIDSGPIDAGPIDTDGWLHTGDLGRLDADGLLHVHGRRSELIITGGENVWPEVVERCLIDHPAIDDVAVAGVDDPEWGQRVVAWIVSADPPGLDAVRAHVAERLPRFMAPKELRVVSSIPRTALGKIARGRLR
jgi:O-succinylbenzoic acid--CoA ligase